MFVIKKVNKINEIAENKNTNKINDLTSKKGKIFKKRGAFSRSLQPLHIKRPFL